MFFIPKTFLIFYTIPIISGVSLRIDGLIDLGPNWSYEYRILAPNEKQKDNIARDGAERLSEDPHPRHELDYDEKIQREKERLQKAEDRLRKEAEELRKAQALAKKKSDSESLNIRVVTPSHNHQTKPHKHHQEFKPMYPTTKHVKTTEKHKPDKEKHFSEIIIVPQPGKDLDTKRDSDMPKHMEKIGVVPESDSKHVRESKYTTFKPSTFSSASEESSSLIDSDEAKTTQKKRTVFDMYDMTTSRKPRTHPTPDYYDVPKKKKDHGDTIPFLKEGKDNKEESLDINPVYPINGYPNRTSKHHHKMPNLGRHNFSITVPTTKKITTTTKATTTAITTIRTLNIYGDVHKVKDDPKITEFTNHLYKQTLKVFDTLKHKTNEYYLRKQVDVLAKSYEQKFKEFLRDTSSQKIKTRLGTQKVILNTIDMSNRILKRLINFMIGDLDRKGVLRNNLATANVFAREVDKEQTQELAHACKKFGICRTGNGFPEFLTEVLTVVLKCDERKFKQSIDAVTEVVKNTDFNEALNMKTERKLKSSMEKIEMMSPLTLRPMLMIIKNIIANKNKPLVINNFAASQRVNATLAFLEIIDLMDQKTPRNEANILEWNDMRTSLIDFAEHRRFDVQDIAEVFIKHLRKTLRSMDESSQAIINKNLNILFGEH